MTYRGSPEPCPRCASRLEQNVARWHCLRCHGVLLPLDDVLALVRQMAPDLHPEEPLPIKPRTSAGPLACPFDSAPLTPGRFGTIAIDHCDHGMWFDGDELQQALEAIGLHYAERESAREPGRRKDMSLPAHWFPSRDHEDAFFRRLVRWAFGRDEPHEP